MERVESEAALAPILYYTLSLLFTASVAYYLPPVGTWLALGYPSSGLAVDIVLCLTNNLYLARCRALLAVLYMYWCSWPGLKTYKRNFQGRGTPVSWEVTRSVRRPRRFRPRESLDTKFD